MKKYVKFIILSEITLNFGQLQKIQSQSVKFGQLDKIFKNRLNFSKLNKFFRSILEKF